ncbi:hypothetical protein GBZ26_09870 [Azospirillum formosense]|uniref:UDP-2,4-diacetamido-2,4, 6-trideoxy-beta-L-altropyranose hydrolase n=1 Tax=Azospirillum formosense TaxID=861533 RepID=A0ABX2KV63_9PROT|nr:hypothetical protein [Azospirillum formosense]MBY3757592.1 hypothetical protein [Azospirillum formosense]NUB19518.1 hypothetical protein [Azospirillum formosense]
MPAAEILIRVDGGHVIGLGHIFRMRALAHRLIGNGFSVALAVRRETPGETVLREAGLVVHGLADDEAFLPLAQTCGAGIVILDVLNTSVDLLRALRRAGIRRLVTLDDEAGGLMEADLVINSIVSLAGRYDATACRAQLCEGPAYMILQPEMARSGPPRPVPDRARRLLLCFGGSDTRGLSARVLSALGALPGPLDLHLNLGPAALQGQGLISARIASPHPVTVMRGVPDLAACFRNMDLVLCAGGIMLYELAALGVPAAAIASEPHERATIDFFVGAGCVLDLGYYETLRPSDLTARLASLLDSAARRRDMARCGPLLVDGGGLERCVRLIGKLAA